MVFLRLLTPMGIDFRVYWETAWLVLHGHNPYYGIISSVFPFNYPPPALFLIWPLGLLTMTQAAPVWNISSTLAVIISIWLILKLITTKPKIWLFFLLSFLFTIPFFPVKFNIGNGQINHFLLLFSVLGIFCYSKNHKNLAAFFIAFAASIKLAPLVFLLYFLIKKDWRQIIRTLIFFVGFFAAPFIFFSWNWQRRYYEEIVFWSFTTGAKDWYYNQSLSGFLARSFTNQQLFLPVFYGLSTVIVTITWFKARSLNFFRAMSAVTVLYLLIHPIALQHYFGFAIIPLLFLGSDLVRNGAQKIHWLGLVTAYCLFAFDVKNFAAVPKEFTPVLSHMFFGSVLLWLLSLWKEKYSQVIFLTITLFTIVTYFFVIACRANFCI